MSDNIKSGIAAGFISLAFWFGFNFAFDSPKPQTFILAPVFFAVAFGIAMVIGRTAAARRNQTT